MKTVVLNVLRKHVFKVFIIEKKNVFTVLTILTLQIHVSHGTMSKRNNSNS